MSTWGDSYNNKSNSNIRLLLENFNGMQLGKHHRHPKINKLRELCNNMEIDILGGTETQTNWQLTTYSQRLSTVFKSETALKAIAVCNSHESFNFHQEGGTALLAFDQITSYVVSSDPDPSGLGRWCSMLFQGKEGIKTRVIVAYMPGKGSYKRLRSVKAQHRRYLQSLGDNRCPRKAAREDLTKAVDKWIAEGERIILFADANESVRNGKLTQSLNQLGLREHLSHHHPQLEEPNTWFMGSKQIDGIWLSPEISPDLSCFLPFGLTVGDHRAIMLDIPVNLLVGEEPPPIIRPNARRLQVSNPRVEFSYNNYLERFCLYHRLLDRYYEILTSPNLSQQQISTKLEHLDKQLGEGMKAAEKRCRKLKMGCVPFSPKLNLLGKVWCVWKLIVRHKLTRKIKRERIKRLARTCNIIRPLSYTLEEALRRCREARNNYLDNKPSAKIIRNNFLSSDEDIPLADRELQAERASNNLIQKETSRAFWRKINAFRKKSKSESVVTVKVSTNGTVTTETTKEGVEAAIIAEVSQRFRLTERWSTFRGDYLAKTLGLVGNTRQAQAVLNNTFASDEILDSHTKKVLEQLAISPKMRQLGPIRTSFTAQDFQRHWKKARESTSSSLSGLHFGHYKAATRSPLLSELHAIKVHLSVNHGIPLQRWSRGLQVMLLKIQGIVDVDKLWAILLLEGNYNWTTLELIGRRMITHARIASEIPAEHFGGLKDITSIDLACCRCFNWDLLRQLRWAGGVASVNASNCYNRVVHNAASLAAQHWGVPVKAITCILEAIRIMQFFLRTGHGDSTQSYGGSWQDPFQGLCQGNGSASGLWLSTNSVLVKALRAENHVAKFITAITQTILLLAALIFVDDTDILKHTKTASPDATTIIPDLQEAIDLWQGLLRVTGGDLKQKKCCVQLVGFKWRDGHPTYRRLQQAPVLTILDNNGERVPIQYYDHDEAIEVVGVWQAPCGSMKVQLEKLGEKAADTVKALAQGGADRSTTAVHFTACLWRSIAYPLPAMNMTVRESLPLEKALYNTTLSNLGLTSSFPTTLRFLPHQYFGMQLPRPYAEMNFAKLAFWFRHSAFNTVPGHFLKAILEELTLEIGCPGNVFTVSFDHFGHLATNGWIKGLWEYLSIHKLRLEFNVQHLYIQREHDEFLIPMFFNMGATPEELTRLNRCRLHTHTITLSDVVTGDGKRLRKESLCTKNDQWKLNSKFHPWPTTKPQRRDWELWRTMLQRRMSPFSRSKPHLGSWYSFSHEKVSWWYSSSTSSLFCSNDDRWQLYKPTCHSWARPGSTFHFHSETTPSSPLLRATVQQRGNNSVIFDGASPSSPPLVCYTLVDSFLADLNSCWLLRHSKFPDNIQIYATCPIWRLVCDGSYMPHLNRTLGAAAWMIEVLTGCPPCHGATDCPGICSDSYRPELSGLLAGLCAIFHLLHKLGLTGVKVEIACDNDSALSRCGDFIGPMPTNLSNSDLLRAIYRLIQHLTHTYSCKFKFTTVEGHADRNKEWASLTRIEQMNCYVDHAAKSYLRTMIENNVTATTSIPFSGWTLHPLASPYAQSSLHATLLDVTSRQAAKEYWVNTKHRLTSTSFDMVNWTAIGKALSSANTNFCLWASKHVSGFCATAKRMHLLYPHKWPSNLCPSCRKEIETIFHIPLCSHQDIKTVFTAGIEKLRKWLISANTDPPLVEALITYLQGRGNTNFQLSPGDTTTRPFGRLLNVNTIGYNNFLLGHIPSIMTQHQEAYFRAIGSNRSSHTWSSDLVYGLLSITRACWLKRNRLLYSHLEDYVSDETYTQLTDQIVTQYQRGPGTVAQGDRYLWETPLREILDLPVPDRHSWLYSVSLACND